MLATSLLVVLASAPQGYIVHGRPAAAGGCADLTSDGDNFGAWAFDNAATDSGPNGNDLTAAGGIDYVTSPKQEGTHAARGDAAGEQFDATNASLATGTPGKTAVAAATWGIKFRVTGGLPGFTELILKAGGGQEPLELVYSPGTGFSCRAYLASVLRIADADADISADTDYSVHCNYDGSNLTLRINGTDQADVEAATGNMTTSSNDLTLCERNSQTIYCDDAYLMDRSLSDAEMDCIDSSCVKGSC